MKKIILLLSLLIYTISYSQYDIHIGQSYKSIYSYYKNKGYNIKFYGDDKDEYLNLIKDETLIVFYNSFYKVDNKSICTNQDFAFSTKDKFYEMCDKLNIGDDYNPINEHKPVNLYLSSILCRVYKFTSKNSEGKTIYCISIIR